MDATVVPPAENGFVQAAGVLDSDGTYCAHGALWRRFRPLTTEPARPEGDLQNLPGRWLWGGVLWAHFGHFLVESTSRLWALEHLDQPVDGVLFIPKRPRAGENLRGFHTGFLDMMAPGLPIRVATAPTQVEELIVPGQGFGLGLITAGTDRFRTAIHNRFAKNVAADGPERIYLSRSALGLGKGGLLGEERLEELLQAEGYEIFHPQQHDLATQIARYKAAKQMIAADGSAVHLYAMVGRPDQAVAMILRRQSRSNNLLADNVRHFCGTEPTVISALRTEWVRKSQNKSSRLSFGELDHAAIGAALARSGFISEQTRWPLLTEEERKQVFADKGLNKSDDFIESPGFVRQRVRAMRQARRTG
ncbi:glycosyltransferase 61 family protein [Sedimentitalea todarodis]|uniref:Glycosyltransferase 61 family protein n=1 Tax=Sedimentitalea todarodis TaxID=1631240 RepID=A0ABU3VG53_9RHOB|nr:glycosyltransferase 61 family protein [Sedimentitalea todarodis]MDU9005145.1 glycosyltransferase 61 family protein [Sedimentitalea todarodis]